MSMDVKKTYRDVEEKSREFARELDGHDVGDDVGNAGDDIRKNLGNAGNDIRKNLGNAGDDIRRGLDDAGDEMENQHEWSDDKPAADRDPITQLVPLGSRRFARPPVSFPREHRPAVAAHAPRRDGRDVLPRRLAALPAHVESSRLSSGRLGRRAVTAPLWACNAEPCAGI